MVKNVIIGYHAIDHTPVKVSFTTETGRNLQAVGCKNKWLLCDRDNNMKYCDNEPYGHLYATYFEAIRAGENYV